MTKTATEYGNLLDYKTLLLLFPGIKKENMHEKLITLPLFQGMSKTDIETALGKIHLREKTVCKNTKIVESGQNCRGVFFLVEGTLEMETISEDGKIRVTEVTPEPYILEIERLFGLQQRYLSTYTTRSQCKFLYARKDDILYLLNENIVFRLNVLNILSTLSQRRNLKLWTTTSSETESHIIRFIHQHCRLQIGRKTIYIKMNSLAEAIHASRIEVSVALNKMNNERRIVLQRGIITIPEISQLNY